MLSLLAGGDASVPDPDGCLVRIGHRCATKRTKDRMRVEQTTVNLLTPQRVSGFARHLTRGRSMGVRFGARSPRQCPNEAQRVAIL